MKKAREITIYDIAERLNISAATVSRGLHDHPSISKKTKKKINQMVTELGYRTNHVARNLRKQQSKTIGVMVHEIRSNFITSVLAGIEKIATDAGYDLIIVHSSESYKKEAAHVKNLFNKRVDGLIASLAFDTIDTGHFKIFTDKNIPIIFFDRVEENENNTIVIIDNAKSGYAATQHLIDQGCTKIALVTSNLNRNVYAQRFKGYRDALRDNELPFEESYLVIADLSEAAGREAARQVMNMKPLPDGVFITNDFVAAVFIKIVKEHGYRIPEDIAVVGFNNDAISNLIEPTLTTIDYPGMDIGEVAATNLINHLQGLDINLKARTIVVSSRLIIRKSSLKKLPNT